MNTTSKEIMDGIKNGKVKLYWNTLIDNKFYEPTSGYVTSVDGDTLTVDAFFKNLGDKFGPTPMKFYYNDFAVYGDWDGDHDTPGDWANNETGSLCYKDGKESKVVRGRF